MTDPHRAETPRGLPRAREVLDRIEHYAPARVGESATAAISAQALHVSAIAAVELAAATQLVALATVTASPEYDVAFDVDERLHIVNTMRALLGFADIPDKE